MPLLSSEWPLESIAAPYPTLPCPLAHCDALRASEGLVCPMTLLQGNPVVVRAQVPSRALGAISLAFCPGGGACEAFHKRPGTLADPHELVKHFTSGRARRARRSGFSD